MKESGLEKIEKMIADKFPWLNDTKVVDSPYGVRVEGPHFDLYGRIYRKPAGFDAVARTAYGSQERNFDTIEAASEFVVRAHFGYR